MIDLQIMQQTLLNGGSSTSLKNKVANSGYMVALYGKEKVINKLSSKEIRKYINNNLKELNKDNIFIGTWVDTNTNKIYLDCSINVQSKEKALKLAKQNKQLAIFDLNSFDSIYLN